MSTLEDRSDTDSTTAVAELVTGPTPDPAVLGLPTFVIGSIALGFALVGYLPASAGGSILPIVLAATGLGLLVAAVWGAALGQSMLAAIFGIFAGFWWSYAALVLGLAHKWYAVPAADATKAVGVYLLCWTILIGVLTVATLRLPAAFSALLALVTAALALVTAGTLAPQESLVKIGGWVVLAFAALGVYLFLSAAAVALGGASLKLGRPLQH